MGQQSSEPVIQSESMGTYGNVPLPMEPTIPSYNVGSGCSGGAGPFGFESPEKCLAKFPGRDHGSLRDLTVSLARRVVFGDEVLAKSSRSGHYETNQLDKDKLLYIKTTLQNRVGNRMSPSEFELVWKKYLESLGKQCQKL